MKINKLKKTFEKFFKIKKKDYSNFSQKNFKKWDSINHINLMLEIEKDLNIKLSDNEIYNIKSFKDLEKIIKKK